MKVAIHHNQLEHQQQFAAWMHDGVRACHDHPIVCGTHDAVTADVHVYWGQRYVKQQPFVVAEAGYVNGTGEHYVQNRLKYISLNINGMHGHGKRIRDMAATRAEKHFIVAEPWQDGGDYCVIFGQVPTDYSVEHLNYREVLAHLIHRCRDVFGMDRVRFRPHPLFRNMFTDCDVIAGSLNRVLKQCFLAVTVNSNAAVDALLAGVPTITTDTMSIAYEVTLHEPIANVRECRLPREQWVNNLAWRQWTADEIESGHAWEFLKWAFH